MSNKQNTSRVKREMLNGDDEGASRNWGAKTNPIQFKK